ncbi:MAG: hypothetical protein ACI87E_004427 [Mariniblastus sp.]|jgi:hypothetical protein
MSVPIFFVWLFRLSCQNAVLLLLKTRFVAQAQAKSCMHRQLTVRKVDAIRSNLKLDLTGEVVLVQGFGDKKTAGTWNNLRSASTQNSSQKPGWKRWLG